MDSPRRQRSISLCQPHSTTPHPSRAGVPTRLPDALGCRPSTAGGQGATLSTFPLVLLTREPTCTQAIDLGISRSTLTPADTSRPSRSSGHLPDFPGQGSPWLVHGSPLQGDWFPNPMGLLLGAFGLPALPMSLSPLPLPGTGSFPASHGLSTPSGCCAALATRPSPPCPLVPSSRVYTPPGRLLPCGAGPLGPLPSGDRFARLARVAPFPPPSLSPVPRPRPNPLGCRAAPPHPSSRVYTPPGRQQPCGAGPLDPHPSGDRFVRLARVAPFPPPSPLPRPRPIPLGCRTGVHALCVVLRVRCPGPPGSCSPVCSPRVWCCVYGVLGLLAPVHCRARPVCGDACTVSLASWLQLTGVHALCVVLRVRCPGPLGSCSPACTLSVCCCVRCVLGRLAPVHRCA